MTNALARGAPSSTRASIIPGDLALGLAWLLRSPAPVYALGLLAFLSVPSLPYGFLIVDVLLVVSLVHVAVGRPRDFLPFDDPVLGAALLFLVWAAVSIGINLDRGDAGAFISVTSIAMFMWCIAAYVASASLSTRDSVLRFAAALIVAACVNSAATAFVWFTTTGGVIERYNFLPPFSPGFGAQFGFARIGFLLALGLFASRAVPQYGVIWWGLLAALGVTGSTFVLVLTRLELLVTPVLAITVFILSTAVAHRGMLRKIVSSLGFVAVAVAGFALFTRNVQWLGDITGGNLVSHTVIGRLLVWQHTWELIGNHPVIGIGLGGSLVTVGQMEFAELGEVNRFATPHNGVLSIWLETGAIGLAAAAGFFAVTLGALWRRLRTAGDPVLRALIVVVFVQVAWLAASHLIGDSAVFVSIAHRPASTFIVYQWLLLGLATAAWRAERV